MADNFVQIAPDSTGKQIDSQSLLNSGGATVHRQTVTLGDGSNINAVQTVRQGASAAVAADSMAIVGIRPDSGGTTGLDNSANPPAWPTIGSNFGGSGTYAGWFLLATVPANPSRLNVTADNMSSQQVLVLRDDGTATSGGSPANATAFILNPKVAVGPEGGHYESSTFRGRLQIYGASASQYVSISTD